MWDCGIRPIRKSRTLKIKPDWNTYLHQLRRREIEIVFGDVPAGAFARGLELGAGDGFQSQLLARYARSLVVTDYYPEILARANTPTLTHRMCDAEQVGAHFEPGEFDLIFSSNMMEHLPDLQAALAGMRRVLRDDGIAVHVMPSPFWKLCQIIGFYPNAVISRVERYTVPQGNPRPGAPADQPISAQPPSFAVSGNNPKVAGRRYSYLHRLLWATPHGVSKGNVAEFAAFRRSRWRRELAAAGFTIAKIIAGPVSSGYGFGWDGLRTFFERLGATSEYAYVTVKAGAVSPQLAYFRDRLSQDPKGFWEDVSP